MSLGLFPAAGDEKPWDVAVQPREDGPFDLRNVAEPQRFRINTGRTIRGIVRKGARAFSWLVLNFLLVEDDEGEHAAGYDKTYKTGNADAWARCMELRDVAGRGTLNGSEIDVLSRGREPDGKQRRGLLVVFGKSVPTDTERPVFDFGIQFVPNGSDPTQAFTTTLIDGLPMPCENFLAQRPGSWYTIDRDKQIGWCWDEENGWLNLGIKGQPPTFRFQLGTGEIQSRGRKVIGPA